MKRLAIQVASRMLNSPRVRTARLVSRFSPEKGNVKKNPTTKKILLTNPRIIVCRNSRQPARSLGSSGDKKKLMSKGLDGLLPVSLIG
jgi:hypothetical protein